METFRALLGLSERNPPVTGGFPWQRPVARSADVFFDLRLINRDTSDLRRHCTQSLCRHCDAKKIQTDLPVLRRPSKNGAWRHQTITLTNVDLSSNVFCGIHQKAILSEVLINLIRNTYSKNKLSKLLKHLPGANEFKSMSMKV